MRGAVDVELGGSNKILKFDFNALCEMEEHFGVPAQVLFNKDRVGLRTLRDSLYIGLRRFHEGVTVEEVGDWLEEAAGQGRFQTVAEKLSEALQFALNGLEGPEGNGPAPETTGASETARPKRKDSTTRNSSSKRPASG